MTVYVRHLAGGRVVEVLEWADGSLTAVASVLGHCGAAGYARIDSGVYAFPGCVVPEWARIELSRVLGVTA